jgi:hypothetical protein
MLVDRHLTARPALSCDRLQRVARSAGAVAVGRLALALALFVAALALLAGCAKKDKNEIPVAKIQDRVVSLAYYERKLNGIDQRFLPSDIQTHEGRMKFLDTIVEKEVMAIKAEELGFAANPKVQQTASAVSQLKSVTLMKEDVVKPAQDVTEQETQEYYENFGRNLRVSCMVFDHLEQAQKAKKLVEGGEDWLTVARRMSVGPVGPNNNYTMTMKYGTVADDLEKAVFALDVDQVSDPIPSYYGFFLVRLDGQVMERVEPLDKLRDTIVASVRKSKAELLTLDFIHKVFDEYRFTIDEAVLDTLFAMLPQDVELIPPKKPEEMEPLHIPPDLLDKVLMSYADQTWTLERYQQLYSTMSSLGRPRREHRLGGLRRSLQEIAIRELMPMAAKGRGYLERAEVQDELKLRREQNMVTLLHDELIMKEVKVQPSDVDTFWAKHSAEFRRPETRELYLLAADTEDQARAAVVKARQGQEWSKLVEEYVPAPLRQQSAQAITYRKTDRGILPEMAFSVPNEGGVSEPRETLDHRWAVVKVLHITSEHDPTLEEARESVGKVVEARMADALFQQKVSEWKAGMKIKLYPRNVDKAVLSRTEGAATSGAASGAAGPAAAGSSTGAPGGAAPARGARGSSAASTPLQGSSIP